MKLSRRGAGNVNETEADILDDASADETYRKGRPTPKRRESQGRRGPVSAPKTRKEALARQRQLTKEQKARSGAAPAKPRSAAEQRAALKRGDPSVLPRRDQGPTRALARNYVDSRRMFSNYLLLLFPLFLVTSVLTVLRRLEPLVFVIFLALVLEWYLAGKKLRALAIKRLGSADGSVMSLGFYMGSRAYLPRRLRIPAPQVHRGDEI